MPNNSSVLDELGFNNADTQGEGGGDPAVWTLLGEAGSDPHGQLAVASTFANRAKLLKASDYSQVVTDPKQGYEAWQDEEARANTQKDYPVDSPAYKQAETLLADLKSGKVQPLPYDSFYSPAGQSKKNRPPPVFEDNKTGIDIGGNRFFVTKEQNNSKSVLDDLGFSNDVPASQSAPAPETKTPLSPESSPIQVKDGWPVHDPYNNVWRNQDGSIAAVSAPVTVRLNGENEKTTPIGSVGRDWSTDPNLINQWLKSHPADLAHKPNQGARQSTDGPTLTGFEQGLANVKNSVEGGINLVPGHPFTNDLVQNLLNRKLNDITNQNSLGYGFGKFGGELAATAPILAVPGLGELGEGALAGTRFGPAAEFLGGRATGGALVRGSSLATQGALQGGETAALTSAGSDKPLSQQMAEGAAIGGVANPVIGGASHYVRNMLSGGSTEGVTDNVRNLAQTAINKYGIPIRLGQIKGVTDRAAATNDSEFVGSNAKAAANNAEQKSAFTRAVSKTFGSNEDHLTPNVMETARTRIGDTMNEIANRTDITQIDPLLTKLGTIAHDASQVVPDTELKPILNQIKNIADTISDGKLSGSAYKALVRKGSALDKAANGPVGNIRAYAQDIRNALDDAAEAEMAPGDKEVWDKARLQYKNLMTVRNLAAKANVEGEIQPGLLTGAVNTNFKNNAFQGAGDLGELALIGRTFLKEPPNSFTNDRFWSRMSKYVPGALGGAGAADFGLALHDPILAAKLAGGAASAAMIKGGIDVTRNALRLSPEVRNKFLDKMTAGTSLKPFYIPNHLATPATVLATENLFNQKEGRK